MDLRKEILLHALAKGEIRVTFPGLKLNAADIIETESYKTLQKTRLSSKMTALMILCVLRKSCVRLTKPGLEAAIATILGKRKAPPISAKCCLFRCARTR